LIYYRGYILIRLKIIGTQWKIVEKLKKFHPEEDREWKITYTSPTYGGWDLIIECAFNNLEDLDEIVSFCRFDNELKEWIEATTTLISTKRNYKL
jgi:DNA-binding Lrp family transcriptional regulator